MGLDRMRVLLSLCVLGCLLAIVAGEAMDSSTTLDVRQRCGSCNYGTCESQTLQVGSCEPLYYACTNFGDEYYKVLVGDDGQYYFRVCSLRFGSASP